MNSLEIIHLKLWDTLQNDVKEKKVPFDGTVFTCPKVQVRGAFGAPAVSREGRPRKRDRSSQQSPTTRGRVVPPADRNPETRPGPAFRRTDSISKYRKYKDLSTAVNSQPPFNDPLVSYLKLYFPTILPADHEFIGLFSDKDHHKPKAH